MNTPCMRARYWFIIFLIALIIAGIGAHWYNRFFGNVLMQSSPATEEPMAQPATPEESTVTQDTPVDQSQMQSIKHEQQSTQSTAESKGELSDSLISDFRQGFTSLNQEYKVKNLPHTGTIPPWLNGSFVAVGPGKFEINGDQAKTWLDGFAMIHRFSFKNGQVSYANKFIESMYYLDSVSKGKMSDSASAADPNASYFSKLAAAMSNSSNRPPYDNTNVNIINHNHTWLALTETPQPLIIDRHTLRTKGLAGFDDEHKPHVNTPHPFIDKDTGELINVMITYGRSKSTYTIYSMSAKSFVRNPIAILTRSTPSYIHSFSVTPHYIILTEVPFVVNPYDLVMSGKSYINNFQWKPKLQTELSVIERNSGKLVGSYCLPAFFALHFVNAYEKNNHIIIDVAAHENASMINSFNLNEIRSNLHHEFPQARLMRIDIDLNNQTIGESFLNNQPLEMPRVNPNYKTHAYRYLYALSSANGHDYFDRLVKIDTQTQAITTFKIPRCFPSETTFVPKPNATDEDDGVLLSIFLDSSTKKSFLVIINAATMKEVARVSLNHHIPFILHGNYFPKPTTLKEQLEEQFKLP